MREDTNADFTGRSRKRKADVAVPWNNGDAIYGNPCALIPTPDKEDDPASPSSPYGLRRFNLTRTSPLPLLGWANRDEVWKIMLNKEQTYLRDKHFLQRHPLLQPKMRAILLDWLMEVCEVYKLHRETFYLAQDFFDRFMATQQNIVKTLLQLIGISSLFIAAKLEEIYPPKLHQFAYVTDGACTEDEILSMELIIMKALKWNLSPLTVVSWLNVYMQVAYLNDFYEVLVPRYPQQIFVQITELLDLCVLDVGCLEFPYGVLAASALYHFSSSELMRKVSGRRDPGGPGGAAGSPSGAEPKEPTSPLLPSRLRVARRRGVREVDGPVCCGHKGGGEFETETLQGRSDRRPAQHTDAREQLGFAGMKRGMGGSDWPGVSGDRAQAKQAILAEHNRTSPLPTGVLTPPQSSKKQTTERKAV
uniref:Cyclin E1 n=1 Tax=Ornithorhynchus anatinus TaxID=9258 RepID=A0A6I8P6X6_ORNAN